MTQGRLTARFPGLVNLAQNGVSGTGEDYTDLINEILEEQCYKAADQRVAAQVWVPPGRYGIDTRTSMRGFDNVKIVCAGEGSVEFFPIDDHPGALFKRATGDRHQYQELHGARFIVAHADQGAIDATEMSRSVFGDIQITPQTRETIGGTGEWLNTPQTINSGTFGIRLNRGSGGGDRVTLERIKTFYMERSYDIQGGYAHVLDKIESNTSKTGIFIAAEAEGISIRDPLVQYWDRSQCAIDCYGKKILIDGLYMESHAGTSSITGVRLRSGSSGWLKHMKSYLYASPGAPLAVQDDSSNNWEF